MIDDCEHSEEIEFGFSEREMKLCGHSLRFASRAQQPDHRDEISRESATSIFKTIKDNQNGESPHTVSLCKCQASLLHASLRSYSKLKDAVGHQGLHRECVGLRKRLTKPLRATLENSGN